MKMLILLIAALALFSGKKNPPKRSSSLVGQSISTKGSLLKSVFCEEKKDPKRVVFFSRKYDKSFYPYY